MCTLTWRHEAEGYDLFFNRDERKTRQRERPPDIFIHNGVELIAPRDGDGGGTWLAVNASGITHALLNYYDLAGNHREPGQPLSRGLLPLRLASLEAGDEPPAHPQRFRPFHLVKVAPGGLVRHWIWDGEAIRSSVLDDGDRPLTTSSFDPARAVALRVSAFEALGTDPDLDALEKYHRSTSAHGRAYGVLMQRGDAQTMSITHVRVTGSEVTVLYEPLPRGREGRLDPSAVSMARRRV